MGCTHCFFFDFDYTYNYIYYLQLLPSFDFSPD